MPAKNCSLCGVTFHHGYRIQQKVKGEWSIVCGKCCLQVQKGEYYAYGGTWKSKEKRQGKQNSNI